jgi:hypothetical protein
MKKLVYLLLCLALPASAQQFTVTVDTIHIDAGLFGKTPKMNIHLRAADSREGLYLLMYHRESMESWGKNNLLFVERNNRTIRNIELPDILPIGYTDFQNIFVRHDSLILKVNAYHESDVSFYRFARERHDKEEMKKNLNFTLNTHTGQWKPVKSANDLIYEDDQYRVCYWECGEWGDYMVFQERKNRKRHLFMAAGRLLKLDGSYYVVSTYSINKIDNPRHGKVYRGKKYYKLGREDYTLPQKVLQLTPPESRIITITKEYLLNDPRTYICTAFTHDDKLYCIVRSPEGMYIASYQDGALHKEMDLGFNYNTENWRGHLLRVNNHPDNQAFFQCEDVTTDNPVIVSVNGTNIRVTYIE